MNLLNMYVMKKNSYSHGYWVFLLYIPSPIDRHARTGKDILTGEEAVCDGLQQQVVRQNRTITKKEEEKKKNDV